MREHCRQPPGAALFATWGSASNAAPGWQPSKTWMPALDEFGRLLGGVLFPAVLILGLALALRTYVCLGLPPRL